MPEVTGPSAELLLHATFDGNAELAAAAGGQTAGSLHDGAAFIPARPGAPGQAILSSADREPAVTIPLEGNVRPERGTMMFWFQPQTKMAGTPENTFDVIDCGEGKGLRVRFISWPYEAAFIPRVYWAPDCPWQPSSAYKHLLAGKWYHAAFTWDVEADYMACYMFGRIQADTIMEGMDASLMAEELTVGAKTMAIADLRVYDAALTGPQIRSLIRYQPGELLADEGLVYGQQRFDVDAIRGELLHENPFDDPATIADWRMEGPGMPEVIDGRLSLQTALAKSNTGSFVYWMPPDLPESFIAEWDITPVRAGGLCIIFFCARGRDGQDIFDPSMPERDGAFNQYTKGEVNCYHISYFRNTCTTYPNCNLRKNSGFYLVDIGPDFVTCEAGVTSHVTLIKNKDHVMMLTNGFVSIDFLDDGATFGPVHGSGKIGFRQMGHTGQCFYDNLRVHAVQ